MLNDRNVCSFHVSLSLRASINYKASNMIIALLLNLSLVHFFNCGVLSASSWEKINTKSLLWQCALSTTDAVGP